MYIVIIDITNENLNENDDVYFYIRTVFVEMSVKMVYRYEE